MHLCVQDKTSIKINTCLLYLQLRKNILTINNVCILHHVCNEKNKGTEVQVEGGGVEKSSGRVCACVSVCVCVHFRRAGHSTAPKGESQYRGKQRWVGDGVGWVRRRGGARRRCMKAKALQTIVTLYMTSSCYNNTAVIYCTVQVRLNIWLDKADHYHHLQYP